MDKVDLTLELIGINGANDSKIYNFEEEVNIYDSVRDLAIARLKSTEEFRNGSLWYEDINSETPVHISLLSHRENHSHDKNGHTSFGIKYGLNSNGSIVILEMYAPLHYGWSFKEIKELTEEKYVKGDPTKIYVSLPVGLGAPGPDVFDFIGFMDSSLSLGLLGLHGLKRLTNILRYKKLRQIVKNWQTKNGIRYPSQLREFLSEKGEWKLSEVKLRLGLDEEYAIKLLSALGYEPVKNSWRLTQSDISVKKRKAWMRNEKKYRKSNEEILL